MNKSITSKVILVCTSHILLQLDIKDISTIQDCVRVREMDADLDACLYVMELNEFQIQDLQDDLEKTHMEEKYLLVKYGFYNKNEINIMGTWYDNPYKVGLSLSRDACGYMLPLYKRKDIAIAQIKMQVADTISKDVGDEFLRIIEKNNSLVPSISINTINQKIVIALMSVAEEVVHTSS